MPAERAGVLGPRALWIGVGNPASARLAARHRPAAIWVSSLCASAELLGAADMSLVSPREMIDLARRVDLVSDDVPTVIDCDSGFGDEHIWAQVVEEVARTTSAAAVCIEDKRFPKRNSFYDEAQALVPTDEFVHLLSVARRVRDAHRPTLRVIARTETLVAGGSPDDAQRRLEAYGAAGPDGVFVQAKGAVADLETVVRGAARPGRPPIVLAPSAFPDRSPADWWAAGAAVVIHANQMLRAALRVQDALLDRLMDGSVAPGSLDGEMWSLGELGALVRRPSSTAAD